MLEDCVEIEWSFTGEIGHSTYAAEPCTKPVVPERLWLFEEDAGNASDALHRPPASGGGEGEMFSAASRIKGKLRGARSRRVQELFRAAPASHFVRRRCLQP